MSKKSGKVQQLQSPVNYVKTKARTLPLNKCYTTPEWQDIGLASIVVSRRHITGTYTFGYYLVDLKCLGVKDTFYHSMKVLTRLLK